MKKLSKDKINWFILLISVVSLAFAIIGVSVGIFFSILDNFIIGSMILTILSSILILLLQGAIPISMYIVIRKKEQSKHLLNVNTSTILLSVLNFFFVFLSNIFYYARQSIPITGILLFLAPNITIIAGIFFKDYKFPRKLKTYIILVSVYLVFLFIPFFLDILLIIEATVYFGNLFGFLSFLALEGLFFVPSLILSFFIVNFDDRTQLLEKSYLLYFISAIIGTVSVNLLPINLMVISMSEDVAVMLLQLLLISLVVTLISSFVAKYIAYQGIQYKKLQVLTPLEKDKILLEIKDLKVYYPLLGGFLRRQIGSVKAVDGVSLNVKSGQTLGLVGESGCGKSTLAKAILGLVDIESGKIRFQGNEINIDKYPRELREKIQIVYQDPDSSLNPRMKAIDIITEPLKNLYGITGKKKLRKQALRLLNSVSLKREHLDRYPDEFSGGQKQRLVIARALATNPNLIILDEPTSALDVSVQAQILNLLKDLQRTYNYGFLFITHNLSVVKYIADHIAVMYLGRIVEIGSSEQIFSKPTHPYTTALINSDIKIDPDDQEIKFVIDGEVPSPINPPQGCHFNPRCSSDARTKECEYENPHEIEVEEGHFIWCVNPPALMEIDALIEKYDEWKEAKTEKKY